MEGLRLFGVDEIEAHVYLTLLNCGAETVSELVTLTGMTRADVHAALNRLLEKRMIEVSIEYPTKYGAVPIETALDATILKQAYHLRQMERSKQGLVELVTHQISTRPN